MLKESGNLLAENIPITKELLDFALANNYRISLKTGDYAINEVANKGKYKLDLLSQINELYLNGLMYPGKYCVIFMVSAGRMVDELFRLKGFKTLSFREAKEIYHDDILAKTKSTFVERYGVDHNSKFENRPKPKITKESLEKRRQTNLKKFGVEHPMQLPEFKERVKQTNLELYGMAYGFMSPEAREKAKQTLSDPSIRRRAAAKMIKRVRYYTTGWVSDLRKYANS